jgi:hypothetical protein
MFEASIPVTVDPSGEKRRQVEERGSGGSGVQFGIDRSKTPRPAFTYGNDVQHADRRS